MASNNSARHYGNYHGYHGYTYHHPGKSDPRLSLLQPGHFKGKRVLDIGCNEGWVSCEVAQSHRPRYVVGVDIDNVLVRMAWKRRRTLWSFQEPVEDFSNEPETTNEQCNHGPKPDYFPASCAHTFGYLPLPAHESVNKTLNAHLSFPHNVTFRHADWANESIAEDKDGYDTIVAFSVSKWIHINGGDDGLKRFFRKVFKCLIPGGEFILEPQQWDSYSKARKLTGTTRENARSIKLRPEDFNLLLVDIGFESPERLGVRGDGRFRRPVEIYRKPVVNEV